MLPRAAPPSVVGARKDLQGTGCRKHLEEGERQKQIKVVYSLLRRKARGTSTPELQRRSSLEDAPDLLGHWLQGRSGQRWCFKSNCCFEPYLSLQWFHLFRERMILFITELEITGGKATKKRRERRECLYGPKALEKEKDLKMLRKGMWQSSCPVQRQFPDRPHTRGTPGPSQGPLVGCTPVSAGLAPSPKPGRGEVGHIHIQTLLVNLTECFRARPCVCVRVWFPVWFWERNRLYVPARQLGRNAPCTSSHTYLFVGPFVSVHLHHPLTEHVKCVFLVLLPVGT